MVTAPVLVGNVHTMVHGAVEYQHMQSSQPPTGHQFLAGSPPPFFALHILHHQSDNMSEANPSRLPLLHAPVQHPAWSHCPADA